MFTATHKYLHDLYEATPPNLSADDVTESKKMPPSYVKEKLSLTYSSDR